MLRVHFTARDMARLRVAPVGPLAECLLALSAAQHRAGGALLDHWRLRVRDRLPRDARSLARAWAEPSRHLDLYSTVGSSAVLAESVDRVLSGPRSLRKELPLYPAGFLRRQPPWPPAGIGGGGEAAVRLSGAITSAFETAVGPYWDRISSALSGELATAGRVMAAKGAGGLLERLGPAVRWTAPVLELDYDPYQPVRDLYLSGQGMALVPSFFCAAPQLYGSPDGGELLLIHPAVRDPADVARIIAPPARRPSAALAALLGRTRAAVLECVDDGATGGLARRLRISDSAASKHATVLREAGLLTSHRDRDRVWHTLTPAARRLLGGAAGASTGP
jgi:DNA-binding transcriptional ArsR family regulator